MEAGPRAARGEGAGGSGGHESKGLFQEVGWPERREEPISSKKEERKGMS